MAHVLVSNNQVTSVPNLTSPNFKNYKFNVEDDGGSINNENVTESLFTELNNLGISVLDIYGWGAALGVKEDAGGIVDLYDIGGAVNMGDPNNDDPQIVTYNNKKIVNGVGQLSASTGYPATKSPLDLTNQFALLSVGAAPNSQFTSTVLIDDKQSVDPGGAMAPVKTFG